MVPSGLVWDLGHMRSTKDGDPDGEKQVTVETEFRVSVVDVRDLVGLQEGSWWTSVGFGRHIWGTAFMYSREKIPGWSMLTGGHQGGTWSLRFQNRHSNREREA